MIREPQMSVVLENAEYRIGEYRRVLANGVPDGRAVELLWNLGRSHRAAAIAQLLISADPEPFVAHLVCSGDTRKKLLAIASRAEGHPDFRSCASVVDSLLDVLAAGRFDLAREIALASPTVLTPNAEIAEDFHYAQILHGWSKDDFASLPESLLSDFERSLAGGGSTRLGVCAALCRPDQAAFDDAFHALLAERLAIIAEKDKGPLVDPQRHTTGKYVFVEGLALLRVAGRLGLGVDHLTAPGLPDLVR